MVCQRKQFWPSVSNSIDLHSEADRLGWAGFSLGTGFNYTSK